MKAPRIKTPPTEADVKRELDALDLLPAEQAARRTDALLRNMLASPPDPHAAKPQAKKRK